MLSIIFRQPSHSPRTGRTRRSWRSSLPALRGRLRRRRPEIPSGTARELCCSWVKLE
ncbi:hypothetical protein [Leifsonia sp. Leaf264]|uniref:hypothetical protein n=1 Tax=Leifsonia sp. Leaf264 TaxID=1736314 RepID=UPI003FA5AA9F